MRLLRASLGAAFIGALCPLPSCVSPATAVVIVIESDAPETRPVTMHVQVSHGDPTATRRYTMPLRDDHPNRGSLTVVPAPGTNAETPVRVLIVAEVPALGSAPAVQFTRRLHFSFTRGRMTTTRVYLPIRCGEMTTGCPAATSVCTISALCESRGQTCGDRGECVTDTILTSPFDQDAEFAPLDAAPDVPRADAALDVSVDAPVIDAPRPDVTVDVAPTDVRVDAPVDAPRPDACAPNCGGRACGNDGCGGSCGTCAARANSTATCSGAGACTYACRAGFGDCDGNAMNGCEADLSISVAHCGMCGRGCTATGGTAVCSGGLCTVSMCMAGRGDCDGNATNGCETNTATSVAHCGMCGRGCSAANGTAGCAAGSCTVVSCSAGFSNCDMVAGNGCETPLNTTTNCGACGTGCSRPNATVSCATGSCAIASCAAGFGNCDGNAANGCEASLLVDGNCGACGRTCALPNATATCSAGACAVATCTAGYGDCDGSAANGCETRLNVDGNCGTCGRTCSGPQSCVMAGGTFRCMCDGYTGCGAGSRCCEGNMTTCVCTLCTCSSCGCP